MPILARTVPQSPQRHFGLRVVDVISKMAHNLARIQQDTWVGSPGMSPAALEIVEPLDMLFCEYGLQAVFVTIARMLHLILNPHLN
jgi:hypothetical protein